MGMLPAAPGWLARTPPAQARSGSWTGGVSLQIQYQEHYRLKCNGPPVTIQTSRRLKCAI